MALYASTAFNEFENKLLPTQAQVQSFATKRQATHNYLLEGFDSSSNMPLERTVVIGSASRGTIIRPVDDIDLMAVFSDEQDIYENTYANDSHAFINRVRRVLGENSTVSVVGTRGQAVRLFYQSGANVDIAPVFWLNSGGYLLPSGNGGWITTNPDAQATWFTQKNNQLSGQLMPMVRLLKRWNNVHSKHFNSYHLEVVIAETFGSLGSDHRDALAKFFQWAPSKIDVFDPAGHSGLLSSYLTADMRRNLVSRLNNAADRARAALAAEANGNQQEAMRLWRIDLGSEFPVYG